MPLGADGPDCPACEAMVPGAVIDILLLAALPLRLRPVKLAFESFDCRSMLSAVPLTVAPLRPVDVGEGCMPLWDDCLDGTYNSPRFFFGSSDDASLLPSSVSFSPPSGISVFESPVDSATLVFLVEV